MNQLELLERQREAARAYWQAERLRASKEADAHAQNQRDSRAVEDNASAGRDRATKLVEAARAAREKGREELRKTNLSPLPDGKVPSVNRGFPVEVTRAELEKAANLAQSKAPNLNESVAALLKYRADATQRRNRARVTTIAALVATCIGMSIIAIMAYRPLVSEWHYRQVVAAIEAKKWNVAAQEVARLDQIEYDYRDVHDRITANPELQDALIRQWRTTVPSKRAVLMEASIINYAGSVSFGRSGQLLASGHGDGKVRLWDLKTNHTVRTFNGDYCSVAFSPDGKMLASLVDRCDTAIVYDVTTGKAICTLNNDGYNNGGTRKVTFSSDGRFLASIYAWDTVKLWNVETCEVASVLTPEGVPGESDGFFYPTDIAFSPTSGLLAVADTPSSSYLQDVLQIWVTDTGEVKWAWQSLGAVFAVAFSPDGKLVAWGGSDGTIKIAEAENGRIVRDLPVGDVVRGSISFSPDGSLLVAGIDQRTVKILDSVTGGLIQTLTLYDYDRIGSGLMGVAFSPDARLLVTASGTGELVEWQVVEP